MKKIAILSVFVLIVCVNQLSAQHAGKPGELVMMVLDDDGRTRCVDVSPEEFDPYVLSEPVSGSVTVTRSKPIYRMDENGNPTIETATFIVTYNGFSPEAQNAFQFAVDIWASQINSPVNIRVTANWVSLPPNVLGSAGPSSFFRDFPGAPVSSTFYAVSLAEQLNGGDLNSTGSADINSNFNSDFSWYLGTDGQPGGLFDFVDVVLHELCHGLGFSDSFDESGGSGSWGLSGFPVAYDLKMVTGGGDSLLNTAIFPNPSAALGAALTSNDIFDNGMNAIMANSGVLPRIYAPNPWQSGSSIAHLDEATYPAGTINSLMTPQVGGGEAMRTPGPITMGIFQDMGWAIASRILVTQILQDITLAEEATNFFAANIAGIFVDMFGSPVTTSVNSNGDVVATVSNDSLFLSVTPGFTGTDEIRVLGVNGEGDSLTVSFDATVLVPNTASQGLLYGLALPEDAGTLYTIDPNNGSATLVSQIGLKDGTALAIRPSTKELYALIPTSGEAIFGKVDALTGQVAQIAIVELTNLEGLAFDTNDDLYCSARSGDLFQVDVGTGVPTLIGDTGISRPFGIAINPMDGQMWGGSFQNQRIYRINKTTAVSTEVGDSDFNIRGLTFDAEGKLFAVAGSNNSPGDLVRIDTVTGLGTLVGSTGVENMNSLAVNGTIVLGIDQAEELIPGDFELLQNFPNPFNPVTSIQYSLNKRSPVRLTVYNSLGQHVATLVDAVENPGFHTVTWNGKNNQGAAVASGVYLYRIEAGGFSKTRKMLFVR